MKVLTTTAARIIFAVPLAVFGLMHFAFAKAMQGMVPSYIPGGIFWVYATGAALVAAAVSFIINKQIKIAGISLAVFLFIIIVTVHVPGLGDETMRQMAMSNLLKDLGLLGGSLAFAGIFERKQTA